VAVHQNHDYGYLKHGATAAHSGDEARYNWRLGNDSAWHYYSVYSATQILLQKHLRTNRLASIGPFRSRFLVMLYWIWFSCLSATRPIRHRLGLRRQTKVS
jgi:hypothetical protein